MGGEQGVVDWINFFGVWRFNFNIADSAIVVAAFIMIIVIIVEEVKEYKVKKAKRAEMENDDGEKVISATEKEKQELLNKDKDE